MVKVKTNGFVISRLVVFSPIKRRRFNPFSLEFNVYILTFDLRTSCSNICEKIALFSHGKPRPDANLVRGLPRKNKAFYSPETQHGRRVIKVYCFSLTAPMFVEVVIF